MSKKLTIEEFIIRAEKKHGDRYDYALIDYINNKTKITIICPIHGKFQQTPSNHLSGKGCKQCSGCVRLTSTQFIKKSKKKHGNRYNYSQVVYMNNRTKVVIVCSVHGEFEQTPTHHMNGQGCPNCDNKYKENYTSNNISTYNINNPQLEPYGIKCRRSPKDANILEVKCMYCDKWYTPTRRSIRQKIQCIKGCGNVGGESNLYCSDSCKQECPTFGQKLYPKGFKKDTSREVQPALRKLVLERDNWTCQKCESTEDGLHCHHMEGIEINPIESADIDMCITLCKDCHNKLHKRNDCNMRRKKC